MRNRRRRISAGTILMLLMACLTITVSFAVIMRIRKDEGDLAMDAERLLASVNELMEMSQRHSDLESEAVKADIVVKTVSDSTPAPDVQPTEEIMVSAQVAHTPSPQETVSANRTLSMTFGGTIALENAIINGVYDKENARYRYDEILSSISSAVHADLNFAVLDTVFGSKRIANADLVAPLESAQVLNDAGFDKAVLCGQNMLAGGIDSVRETLAELQGRGIDTFGLYQPGDKNAFDVIRINGLQLALLSYTEALSSASKKAVSNAQERESMIRLFSLEQAISDVKLAKQQGAQAVLVFLHWGTDDAQAPSAAQKKTAQALCDAGADVIIGYNSSHVMPVEILQSANDSAHQTVVGWSLGNLLAKERSTRSVVSGALLHVQLHYDGENNDISIGRVEYTPTYCWRQKENGSYPYRVILSNKSVPEGMIQKQREIVARSLLLIQTTMNKGIAVQR